MKFLNSVTVEPPMFLYMMAFMITSVVEQKFYLQRSCRVNLGYSENICSGLNETIRNEIQYHTANFFQWQNIASYAIPLLLAFFLGSWSDRRGRKAVLLSGFIGKTFFSLMLVVNSIYELPVEYVIYTAILPSALTGADVAIFASCFAYLADVTSIDERTTRVAILDSVYLSTLPTGVALGNFLYYHAFDKSFTKMFIVNLSLMILATLYIVVFLKWQTASNQIPMLKHNPIYFLKDFFCMDNVRKTFHTLLKRREKLRRLYLWLLIVAIGFYVFQREERSYMYLFTEKRFHWDVDDYSMFRTYQSTMYVVAMVIGIPLMNRVFKWKDTSIIIVGAVSHILGHCVYTFADEGRTMYIGATFSCLGPCVAPLIKSMMSKVTDSSEKGVGYTILSLTEHTVALISAIFYSKLYQHGLNVDKPNIFIYLTISTQVVVYFIGCFLHFNFMHMNKKEKKLMIAGEDESLTKVIEGSS